MDLQIIESGTRENEKGNAPTLASNSNHRLLIRYSSNLNYPPSPLNKIVGIKNQNRLFENKNCGIINNKSGTFPKSFAFAINYLALINNRSGIVIKKCTLKNNSR